MSRAVDLAEAAPTRADFDHILVRSHGSARYVWRQRQRAPTLAELRRRELEAAIEAAIAALDALDGDIDLEEEVDDACEDEGAAEYD